MTTPEDLFLASREIIERVVRFACRVRGMNREDADEFASQTRLRLIENDYDILRKFKGRSTLARYLTIVIGRLALDFRREQWGKWHPSALARANGPAAIRLEQLVVRDEVPLESALDAIERQFEGVDRAAMARLAPRFPSRSRRVYVGDEVLEFAATESPDAERLLVQAEEAERFERIAQRLKEFVEQLLPQERLLLQLIFEQDLSVAEVARLQQVDQKRLYRTLDRVLAQLRALFEAEGLTSVDLRAMLEARSSPGRREIVKAIRLYGGTRHDH